MVIVETPEGFASFCKKFETERSVVIPILTDPRIHPVVNTVAILFVGFDDDDFVLPFNHNDAKNLPLDYLFQLRHSFGKAYGVQKKALMHICRLGHDLIDLEGLMLLDSGRIAEPEKLYTNVQRHMYGFYHNQANVNAAIPLMQLIAFCEAYKGTVAPFMDSTFNESPGFKFHNQVVLPTCQFMEGNGVHVDEALFITHFGDRVKRNISNGLVFTEYNPYTAAGRISNRFGGVNYSALDKHNGVRTTITSRFANGAIVLIDYESFHLRLIAELIGYEMPSEPLHQYFAKQYFNTETPTPEEYDKGKQITFANLYGTDHSTQIPYFQQVRAYTNLLWETIQANGFIETDTGRTLQLKHIEDPNPGKVFNYLLQLREMEVSMDAIYRAQHNIKWMAFNSKIMMYTYDSILIDFDLTDGKTLLPLLVKELECDGKYPVRVYCGPDYQDLTNITDKVKSIKFEK